MQAGHQEVEKELAGLREYVEQLEGQLHREGNSPVCMVTKSRSDDNFNAVRERRVNMYLQVRDSIPDLPAIKVVGFAAPAPVPPPICSLNTRDISCLYLNPWGSISRQWRHNFQSWICTSQSDFHSQDTGHTRYVIPPLRPTPVTDLVSSSLAFSVHLFSRLFGSDKGVAMWDGGTCGSGSEVSGIL